MAYSKNVIATNSCAVVAHLKVGDQVWLGVRSDNYLAIRKRQSYKLYDLWLGLNFVHLIIMHSIDDHLDELFPYEHLN